MTSRAFRIWSRVHKWTSLISTVFILMLCLTGLPLIFHEEIEHWTMERPPVPADATEPRLQSLVERAVAQRPGEVPLYLFFDPDHALAMVATAESTMALPVDFYYQYFDLRSGLRVQHPQPTSGFMYVMLRLHTDLYAGLPGMLFLGFMGLLLMLAIISGVVLYAPFMRRLDFGTVRAGRSRRVRWLDLHNLLGVVTVAWLSVVTLTGMINTLAMPIEMMWQASELAEMSQVEPGRPVPEQIVPVDQVLPPVLAERPGMEPVTVAFPGTPFASAWHYGVYLLGDTPLTSRLLTPALVDAATGELAAIRDMPVYVKTLFLSQPLHFGDYGGLPLKLIWALLDLITIVVLISGLYLWVGRWRRRRTAEPMEALAELHDEPNREGA